MVEAATCLPTGRDASAILVVVNITDEGRGRGRARGRSVSVVHRAIGERWVLRRSHLPTHLTGNKNHPREYEARRGIFEVRVFPRARAQRAGHEVVQIV